MTVTTGKQCASYKGSTNMLDWVVVDVEIQKTIEEVEGGWNATDKLGVAVACVWQYTDQRMRVYGPDDVDALRERLLKADRISGFNIFNFDFPVIWGFDKRKWVSASPRGDTRYSQDMVEHVKQNMLTRTDDMLRRIWQAMGLNPDSFGGGHKGCGLDAVAEATLGAKKIGHGADAPKWYQEGKIQKVVNYCSDDVALERDLTDFVERYGYCIVKGERLQIPKWRGV